MTRRLESRLPALTRWPSFTHFVTTVDRGRLSVWLFIHGFFSFPNPVVANRSDRIPSSRRRGRARSRRSEHVARKPPISA